MSTTQYRTARTETLLACATAVAGIYPGWVKNAVEDELRSRGITYEWHPAHGCGYFHGDVLVAQAPVVV